MGLHTTPYGSFYVQRDLKTGEIIQVLPVQAKVTPDQLPSVGSLGIDENFIESRRATLEANNVRASDSHGRLQRELATVGGRRLLETGRAVIAQRDDHSNHSSPSADMAYVHAQVPAAHVQYPYSSASSSSFHNQRDNRDCRDSSINVNYTLGEDPHQPSLHMHPVRPWPESLLHGHTVNLPPFRQIDSARAPSREGERRRHDERVSSSHPSSYSYSYSNNSSSSRRRRRSYHHTSRSSHRSNSTALSISSMVTDSEGGSTYSASASEVSTPTALSPIPYDYYYGSTGHGFAPSPAHPGYAVLPPMPPESTGRCSIMVDAPQAAPQVAPQTYRQAPRPCNSRTLPPPPPSFTSPAPAPSSAGTAASKKKQKTVWIIRTLEPRKMAPNGDECDDYEPQRVQTHVETYVAS